MRELDGRRVLVCDDRGPRGEQLCDALAASGARTVHSTFGQPPEKVLAKVLDDLGGLDLAIIWPLDTPATTLLADLALEEWQDRVTRPLRATTLLLRELLHHWLGEGQAANAIVLHRRTSAGVAPAALHSALEALVRSIAKEYGRRGARCNLIEPPIEDPVAIGRLIALTSSSAFSFVTGEVLSIGERRRSES